MPPRKQQQRKKKAANAGGEFSLDVVEGPLAGTVITKQGKTFKIGRTKASKLQIKDDTVSEKHGELIFKDSCWHIRDVGSSNGTAVNGEEVDPEGGYMKLNDGDRIRLGESTIAVFRIVEQQTEEDEAKEGAPPVSVDGPASDSKCAKRKSDAADRNENKPDNDQTDDNLTVLEYIEVQCKSMEDEIMVRTLPSFFSQCNLIYSSILPP